jgi:hypothetical protein
MKIIPQDRTQSVYPKSCVENVDFPDAIDRYKSNEFTTNTCVTFIGSESRFEKFSKDSTHSTLEPRFCPSLNLLIRSGLYQTCNIFVLPAPIHAAEENDVERILSQRCQTKIKIILWKEGESVESLTQVVCDAVDEVELCNAKERIAEDIFTLSQSAIEKGEDDDSTPCPKTKSHQIPQTDTKPLDEEEFRKLIRIKLENHLDSSPENILSKAIESIKR